MRLADHVNYIRTEVEIDRSIWQHVHQALKPHEDPEGSSVFQAILQNWGVATPRNLLPQEGPNRSQVCVAPAVHRL